MKFEKLPMISSGNTKAPPLELLIQWCIDGWKSIPEAQIVSSFKQCGLTKAIDGSEDGLISAFKEGHACAAGRLLLQEKQFAFITGGLEVEAPEPEPEEYAMDGSDQENDEVELNE